jgi:hypothetical protein
VATRYRVKVYDSQIASLFSPGQPAWEEHRKLMEKIRRRSRAIAPRRGAGRGRQIYASHYVNMIRQGRYGARGYVGNTAPHAAWVHDGVKGRIRPTRGPDSRLVVPKIRGSYRFTGTLSKAFYPAKSVAGQRANPWMSRAARQVLASYRK